MKTKFEIGDSKSMEISVSQDDLASFDGEVVHKVCSTFALARNIEWATRQYVLEMKDEDEEGIGTFISIDHKSPALENEILRIESCVESLEGHELICSYKVKVGDRIIAEGRTGQKILKKEKIEKIFSSFQ